MIFVGDLRCNFRNRSACWHIKRVHIERKRKDHSSEDDKQKKLSTKKNIATGGTNNWDMNTNVYKAVYMI